MNRKRVILAVASLFILILVVLAVVSSSGAGKNATLKVLVAPTSSNVKLNGKGIKSGTLKVEPGTYTVLAEKQGFASQSKTVTVIKNGSVFVGIILQSNSTATASWYKTNGEDYAIVQSINNQLFDQTSNQIVSQDPLLKKLPYIGPALSFRVDYGVPSKNSKTGQPGIYIRYHTDQDKQAALQWIKDQGSNPSSLDIIYIQGNF